MDSAKRTVLFGQHQKLGARMTQFGGFEMPVQYAGIIEEHRAVRSAAGVFDLSHMGEFYFSGPRALEVLEHALTNSAARLRDGQAQYTILCAPDGGVIDDLIVYRLADEQFMLCVNASNIVADRDWLMANNRGAEFRDASDETALVAVQGPDAVKVLSRMTKFPIAAIPRFGFAKIEVAGCVCLAARTGYTGEDGFELFVDAPLAERLFAMIIDEGIVPVGLGARDTLRLEAGLPLYGHELDRETTPLDAGLSAYVKFGRDFIGEAALAAERERGLRKRLIGLMTDDCRSIARQAYRVFAGEAVGAVTSGTFSPSLERPIALAFVHCSRKPEVGEKVEVEIRSRKRAATVAARPFYRPSKN